MSISQSERFDLIDKNVLKLLKLERFLIDRTSPSDRNALSRRKQSSLRASSRVLQRLR
ncbi:hypothetical protein MPC4_240031 [Methylocella tundrae]|uniref:Uncharacterized protein n=1 Tax=Methylocella tundrae TaxID=227605 RepID=A0A8B6M841_METTU|nr:hypothetical protein MPC4_240031 [Methylocella tundrae]